MSQPLNHEAPLSCNYYILSLVEIDPPVPWINLQLNEKPDAGKHPRQLINKQTLKQAVNSKLYTFFFNIYFLHPFFFYILYVHEDKKLFHSI